MTFDEDNRLAGNRIPTIFAGAGIEISTVKTRIDQY